MNNTNLQSLEDVRTFLAGTVAMAFSIQGEDARHDWIEQSLRHLRQSSHFDTSHPVTLA